MMYFTTIPSLDSELAQIIGFQPENSRKLKRMADNQVMPSPLKQRKSEGFSVKLDVTHFQPEDISIKVVGNHLLVTGKHGERLDEKGFISRQFTRRYELPKDIDLERMTSKLSTNDILMIEAPLIQKETPKERVIPITFLKESDDKPEEKSEEQSEQREQLPNGA